MMKTFLLYTFLCSALSALGQEPVKADLPNTQVCKERTNKWAEEKLKKLREQAKSPSATAEEKTTSERKIAEVEEILKLCAPIWKKE